MPIKTNYMNLSMARNRVKRLFNYLFYILIFRADYNKIIYFIENFIAKC